MASFGAAVFGRFQTLATNKFVVMSGVWLAGSRVSKLWDGSFGKNEKKMDDWKKNTFDSNGRRPDRKSAESAGEAERIHSSLHPIGPVSTSGRIVKEPGRRFIPQLEIIQRIFGIASEKKRISHIGNHLLEGELRREKEKAATRE